VTTTQEDLDGRRWQPVEDIHLECPDCGSLRLVVAEREQLYLCRSCGERTRQPASRGAGRAPKDVADGYTQ
jgi:DNA-directed RNA polymerase subunit RPC12/RpoP